jgi:hypothetical protein
MPEPAPDPPPQVVTVMTQTAEHKHTIRFASAAGELFLQKYPAEQLGGPARIRVTIEPVTDLDSVGGPAPSGAQGRPTTVPEEDTAMQDRSHHWNRAEHLLTQALLSSPARTDDCKTALRDQLIAAAHVHALLATGSQPPGLDLDRAPGETYAQLAARTAGIAARVASTAGEIAEDAYAAADIVTRDLAAVLSAASGKLAEAADELAAHLRG